MLLSRGGTRETVVPYPRRRLVLVVLAGFAVGFLSGFLGIGGGFLIVPAPVYIGGIDVRLAVGTSLICVGTFGLVTGVKYLLAGKVLLSVVLAYLSGGLAVGYLGSRLAVGIDRGLLRWIYGVAIALAGIYILLKALSVVIRLPLMKNLYNSVRYPKTVKSVGMEARRLAQPRALAGKRPLGRPPALGEAGLGLRPGILLARIRSTGLVLLGRKPDVR